MEEVWAYELCFCKYETGYQVNKLFKTKALAKGYANSAKAKKLRYGYDGWRIEKWEVQG